MEKQPCCVRAAQDMASQKGCSEEPSGMRAGIGPRVLPGASATRAAQPCSQPLGLCIKAPFT